MFGLCEFTFLLVSCYSIVIEPSNYESKYKNLPGWLLLLSDKQTRISFFLSQSLTNLKNPAKGTKGILVNGGSPLTRDFLLVYTLKTTKEANTGASISINGIKVCDLVTRTPNNIIEICGCVRAFKGDIITTHVASAGGYADVYAYC